MIKTICQWFPGVKYGKIGDPIKHPLPSTFSPAQNNIRSLIKNRKDTLHVRCLGTPGCDTQDYYTWVRHFEKTLLSWGEGWVSKMLARQYEDLNLIIWIHRKINSQQKSGLVVHTCPSSLGLAGETAQWQEHILLLQRTRAWLPAPMGTHNILEGRPRGSDTLFWPPKGTSTHMAHIHTNTSI